LAAKKIRVSELAKELGLSNKEALDLSVSMGVPVKAISSTMEDAQADRVRRKAERDGLKRDVQPEEEKPAKKAAAKKAWRQATKRESSSAIVAACRALASDPNLPADRSLIPHPTTWLNRDGWEDEPYPPPTPAQILADRGSRPTPIPPRFDASKLHPDNPIPMPENVRQLLRGDSA
jgi:translation initiation factor IF-2